jgi:hypothetical protein
MNNETLLQIAILVLLLGNFMFLCDILWHLAYIKGYLGVSKP